MLYFTAGWPPKGVYSGRFMFVPGATAESGELLLRISMAPGENGSIETDDRVLLRVVREELRHADLYLRSYVGLTLSGLRYVIRFLWLLLGGQGLLERYYELRTIFYGVAYRDHEDAVAEDRESQPPNLRSCDRRIITEWYRRSQALYVTVVLLVSPVLALMGWLMARHPTLITSEYRDDRLYEHNHALSGVINRVVGGPEDRSLTRSQRLIQRLLGWIRLERWQRNPLEGDWEWLLIKLSVERRLWGRYRDRLGREEIPAGYDDFLRGMLVFVLMWMGASGGVELRWPKTLPILQASRGERSRPPSWGTNDPLFRKLVNFFYLHGN